LCVFAKERIWGRERGVKGWKSLLQPKLSIIDLALCNPFIIYFCSICSSHLIGSLYTIFIGLPLYLHWNKSPPVKTKMQKRLWMVLKLVFFCNKALSMVPWNMFLLKKKILWTHGNKKQCLWSSCADNFPTSKLIHLWQASNFSCSHCIINYHALMKNSIEPILTIHCECASWSAHILHQSAALDKWMARWLCARYCDKPSGC
jgi:hypothetical protein